MLTFAIAALLLIMVPGPDQALITRNALVGGRSGGMLTTFGGVLGLSVHAGAAAVGLSALLIASAQAFAVVKILGACYLAWLGVHLLREAIRSRRLSDADESVGVAPGRAAYLRQGFLSNALNPKVALFFVTFLPQFLATDSTPRSRALLLSAVFAGLYLGWFALYVAGVERFGRWLRQPRVQSRIEQVTGTVLITAAARLLATSR